MEIIRDLAQAEIEQETILTVGSFDGIHIGHQAILRQLTQQARACDDCLSGMVTFDPHPRRILMPKAELELLTTLDEKLELLAQTDLDFVVVLPFTRALANHTAGSFAQQLAEQLYMRELWVGPNFKMGRDREGTLPQLRALSAEQGFMLHIIEPTLHDGQMVSSTQIRELVRAGEMRQAAQWLGRPYQITGPIVHGAGRGRTMGFPTANVQAAPDKLIPPNGVYVACATLHRIQGTTEHHAVVNVGIRPSFDNGHRTIEAHLLDFDGDIYGRTLDLRFIERLRPERHFASIDDLIEQIEQDCAAARQTLCMPEFALG